MASAVLMVVVHGVLLLGSGASGHSHSAGMPAVSAASDASAADASEAAGLLAVIGLEMTTALLAAPSSPGSGVPGFRTECPPPALRMNSARDRPGRGQCWRSAPFVTAVANTTGRLAGIFVATMTR
jgi:hypothetical protein